MVQKPQKQQFLYYRGLVDGPEAPEAAVSLLQGPRARTGCLAYWPGRVSGPVSVESLINSFPL